MKTARILPVAVLLAGIRCAHATSSSIENDIRQLEHERQEAQLSGDWRKIQELNAPDFVDIGASGIRSGADNSQAMQSGALKFDRVAYSDLNVRVRGDVAWVTGIADRSGSMNGNRFEQHFRYTRIYVRRNGKWRAELAQNTRIETQSR